MMSVTIVWLDSRTAKIYHFSDDQMGREVLPISGNSNSDCAAICSHLLDSKQILILSPERQGKEFREELDRSRPDLSRRIVGDECLENSDDAAIAKYAIQYFRKPVRSNAS